MVIESSGDGVNCTGCIYTCSGNGETTTTQCGGRRRHSWYDIASRLSRVECIRYITLCKGWLLNSIKPPRGGHGTTQCRPWSDLPNDILISIASRLGRVECIRFMAVCKGWLHSIKPHGHDRNHPKPCLLVVENSDLGWLSLYTPFPNSKTYYKLKIPELKHTDFRFSKDGWILFSEINPRLIFLLNLLTGARFDLPHYPSNSSSCGMCFTSTPGSSDFMVVIIRAVLAERVTIFTYRPPNTTTTTTTTCTDHDDLKEEGKWTEECYENSSRTSFHGVSCNPIFYKGKFYCLDSSGHLGIFDPLRKNWTTLDRPKCIVVNTPYRRPALRYFPYASFMVDFEGDLVSVFAYENRNTVAAEEVHIFRLDCCKMGWEKVNSLGTGELFVGRRSSISTVQVPYGSSNKLYIPAWKSNYPMVQAPYGIWNKFKFSACKPNCDDFIFRARDDFILRAYSLETKAFDYPSCSSFKTDLQFIWIEIPMSKRESIFHSKWERI